jgi:hypothetical protein
VQVGFLKVSDCVGLEAIFKFGSLVLFGLFGIIMYGHDVARGVDYTREGV